MNPSTIPCPGGSVPPAPRIRGSGPGLTGFPASRATRVLRLLAAPSLALVAIGLLVAPFPSRAQETAAAAAAPTGDRLDGTVLGADDKPIANAWVSILSASPRDGQASTIPIKHYPDCGRFTRTDAQGQFAFSGVNKELLFRLLVAAPGHRTDYIRDADPQYSGTQIRMKRMRITNAPPTRRIVMKVIDPEGRPVPGTRIDVNAYRSQDTSYNSSSSSIASRVDAPAVTDETGIATLDCSSSVEGLAVTVEGPRLARRRLWVTPGEAHLIRLSRGVTVTGVVIDNGNPVTGTTITLDSISQSSDQLMRGFDVATDAKGRFVLTHVPANTKFTLFTPQKEVEALNAGVMSREIETGTNGSTLSVGDLAVTPTHMLRGRVVLSDGQIVPDRTRIQLEYNFGRTRRTATLDADGWFEFLGIPAGQIGLQAQISGYRLSAKNPSKDWVNTGRLVGKLAENHEQFFIEYEPVSAPETGTAPTKPEDRQPHEKPLRPAKIDG
jgi:uncharacterized GH25 family protein